MTKPENRASARVALRHSDFVIGILPGIWELGFGTSATVSDGNKLMIHKIKPERENQ
jgi:hypothetical protein